MTLETHFVGKVATKAIIENDDGHILLVRSARGSSYWELPGGRINVGETIEQGLRREIREELQAEIGDCVLFSSYQREIDGTPTFFIVCLTRLQDPEQTMLLQESELAEAQWVDPRNISNFKMYDDYVPVLDAYLKKVQSSR